MQKPSPLESIMTRIYDCALDIETIADWLDDSEFGTHAQTKSHLSSQASTLREAYSQLRELTGAHPCK